MKYIFRALFGLSGGFALGKIISIFFTSGDDFTDLTYGAIFTFLIFCILLILIRFKNKEKILEDFIDGPEFLNLLVGLGIILFITVIIIPFIPIIVFGAISFISTDLFDVIINFFGGFGLGGAVIGLLVGLWYQVHLTAKSKLSDN